MVSADETKTDPKLLQRILEVAGTHMIPVGGQALAFWAAYYRVPAPATAITKDVDFLGTRADVERLARGLGAEATFRGQKDLTMLAGQVQKELPGGGYISIEGILKRSIVAESPAGRFRVMHPLDVLQGRLENVYGLAERLPARLHCATCVASRLLRCRTPAEKQQSGTPYMWPMRSIRRRYCTSRHSRRKNCRSC